MRLARLVVFGILAVACGGGDPTYPQPNPNNNNPGNPNPGTPGSGNQVSVLDNQYSPGSLSVKVGTTVTWNWGGVYAAHSVTFDDGPDSGQKVSGTYSRTFSAEGAFTYQCTVHGAAMAGTVTVTP